MTVHRGLRADEVWQLPLRLGARATVASSFAHAVNLEVDDDVLTLLAATGRRAPGVLVTDAPRLQLLAPGAEVEIARGWVRAPGLDVDARGASTFSCRVAPAPSGATRAGDPVTADRLRAALAACARPGSFRPGPDPGAGEVALHRRLHAGAADLRRALRPCLDGPAAPETLRPAVAGLVGLGVGLTPSGDDYLVGVVAALLHLPSDGRESPLAPVVAAIRSVLVDDGATTPVSRAFLLAACDARLHEDLAAAAAAATGAAAGSSGLAATFARAAAIGSTSGTDALVGLVDALTVLTPTPIRQPL